MAVANKTTRTSGRRHEPKRNGAVTPRGSTSARVSRRRLPTIQAAIEAFLADRDLSPNTQRSYASLHGALIEHYGKRAPVTSLKAQGLRSILNRGWGNAAAATWNARIAALQSLCRYCRRQGWMTVDPTDKLEHRRVRRNDSRAIPYDKLCTLWSRPDTGLRERLFWRCLYATAARAGEVLNLNIEDLDLGRKRATVIGKGGDRETIVWDATTARLMRRYIGGRTRGPLFVTSRMPNVVPADADRAPDGRARLSYQRAWAIFHEATGRRWTLHQIRHSSLTHLGERGVSAPLLMAKSRHRDLRTLARYVQPGVEAVVRLTAEHDPARRRRARLDQQDM